VRTGFHPEHAQAPPGCWEAAAPASEVEMGDRICPAAEEYNSGPEGRKGDLLACQDNPGNGQNPCGMLQ